jgi:hypothetical protein
MPPWKLHEGKGYEEMPAAELVERFAQVRAETVEFVRSLTPEQWSQRGVDFLGLHSLVDLGTWLANNDRGHLPQIRRLCQGE